MSATTTTINRAASEQPVTVKPHVSFQEPENNRPHSSRPRPKHLQPLAIGQVVPRQRRHSGTYIRYPVTGNALSSQFPHSPSEDTPSSATSLATPSLAAVRQYYIDNNLRTAFQGPQSPRAPPPTPAYNTRRASILTPTGLTARFDKLAASSPVLARGELGSPVLLRTPNFARGEASVGRTYRQRSIVDESRDMLLDNLPSSEISRLGSVVSNSPHSPMVERRLSLPAKPPRDRLREFGHLYLGNVLTSDAFVKALHIRKYEQVGRRDSVMGHHSDLMEGDEMHVPKVGEEDKYFMLRARVFPCAKERKPFMIGRRLNKSDLKAMSAAHSADQEIPQKSNGNAKEKEGNGIGSYYSPKAKYLPKSPRKNGHSGEQKRSLMPIHVDYALRYLPVLALVLLSGHIRKGDQIDLPLPHPEAWAETVAWAYTGRGQLSDGARANLEHLGGDVAQGSGTEDVKKGQEVMRDADESDSELSEPPEDI